VNASATLLVVLYGVVGVASGIVVYRKSGEPTLATLAAVAASVVLWPLWAPYALTSVTRSRGPLAERVALALDDAVAAVAKGPMARVLRVTDARSIAHHVETRERRLIELEARLDSATRPLAGIGAEAGARAELHRASLAELTQRGRREREALEELCSLCELLRMQLVLARCDSGDASSELHDDLWARVMALSDSDGSAAHLGDQRE
jgi:hypothetical protein